MLWKNSIYELKTYSFYNLNVKKDFLTLNSVVNKGIVEFRLINLLYNLEIHFIVTFLFPTQMQEFKYLNPIFWLKSNLTFLKGPPSLLLGVHRSAGGHTRLIVLIYALLVSAVVEHCVLFAALRRLDRVLVLARVTGRLFKAVICWFVSSGRMTLYIGIMNIRRTWYEPGIWSR